MILHGFLASVLLTVLLCLSILFVFSGVHSVYAVGLFSKDEKPFGVSYDDWVAKYWNNWIGKNTDEATPKPGGCLIVNDDNKSDSLVMLMETANVGFPPTQVCHISFSQGVIIPLWIGWCENSGDRRGATVEKLALCAKEQNLGNIGSVVKVDGIPVAKLDVSQSVNPGSSSVNYKINSIANVTQSTSKEFTLVIPADTHIPNQVPGTWQAVSDGWWVFLKPLSPGQHTIFYNIRVTPTGALTSPGTSPHFADITYNIQVAK
jgi:hypothetical protein